MARTFLFSHVTVTNRGSTKKRTDTLAAVDGDTLFSHVTGTNRGSITDTLAAVDRDTVNDYDYVTVRDPNVSQQNQHYELVPFDYLKPTVRSSEKVFAGTDYYIPMQSAQNSVHDSGKYQLNTADHLYEVFSNDKAFTIPSVDGAVSVNCGHTAECMQLVLYSQPQWYRVALWTLDIQL